MVVVNIIVFASAYSLLVHCHSDGLIIIKFMGIFSLSNPNKLDDDDDDDDDDDAVLSTDLKPVPLPMSAGDWLRRLRNKSQRSQQSCLKTVGAGNGDN